MCCVATSFYISTRQARANAGKTKLLAIATAYWRRVTDPRLSTRRHAKRTESLSLVATDERTSVNWKLSGNRSVTLCTCRSCHVSYKEELKYSEQPFDHSGQHQQQIVNNTMSNAGSHWPSDTHDVKTYTRLKPEHERPTVAASASVIMMPRDSTGLKAKRTAPSVRGRVQPRDTCRANCCVRES